MRTPVILTACCLCSMVLSGAALGTVPLTLAPIDVGSSLQAKLRGPLGMAEQAVLGKDLARQLESVLQKGCDGAVSLEVVIVDADPSHPTRKQMTDNPAIDFLGSKSIGGATLTARLMDAAGASVEHVDFEYYPTTLGTASVAASAWADAHLAFQRFADKVTASCRTRARTSS